MRTFCTGTSQSQAGVRLPFFEAVQRIYRVHQVVRIVTAPVALLATATSATYLYKRWKPDSYAQWYLRWISAGVFQEPCYQSPWVVNTAMTNIVKDALKTNRGKERMTLISGLQKAGKTSGVLKECHAQQKRGFFLDLGIYTGDLELEKINQYVEKSLVANKHVQHSLFQKAMRVFFPVPEPAHVLEGFTKAFEATSWVAC